MSTALNLALRNLKFSVFFFFFEWVALEISLEHIVLLNTCNLITLITESEMFASSCLSHLTTPGSFPPRKPVKSAAWGPLAKFYGESLKCVLFVLLHILTEAFHLKLTKEKEREEGKNYTNLNGFLK